MVSTIYIIDDGGSSPSHIDTFTLTDGSSQSLYNRGALEAQRDHLKAMVETAISLDTQETETAIQHLRTCLWDKGWNETQTKTSWGTIIQATWDAYNEVDRTLSAFFNHADKPGQIMNGPRPGWADIQQQLELIEEEVPTLTIPSWAGDGGEHYHATLAPQQNNVAQVRALAANAGRSIEAVALLQGAINCAVYQTIGSHATSVGWPSFDRDKLHAHFSALANNTTQHTYFFYQRTIIMKHRCNDLKTYLENLKPASAEWQAAAQGIGQSLSTATEQARSGVVPGVVTYDPGSVDSSTQNTVSGPLVETDEQQMKP